MLMKQFQTLLIAYTGVSLIIAGLLAIALVLDFVSLEKMRELLVRVILIMGIVIAVSGGLLLLGQLNREE